jgi:hypothetical protein
MDFGAKSNRLRVALGSNITSFVGATLLTRAAASKENGVTSESPTGGSLKISKPITAGSVAQRVATCSSASRNAVRTPAGSARSKNVSNAAVTCAEVRRVPRSSSGPCSSAVGAGWIAHSGAPSSPISFEYAS